MPAEPYDTDRVLTLPNVLSGLRLLGVPFFLYFLLLRQADGWALLILVLSGATDFLDGYLARRWHQVSRVGQLLDPLADRLYILATLLGLAARDIIPWYLVALLVSRDILIAVVIGPILNRRGFASLPVHFLGKVATFALLYAFPLVLLGSDSGAGPLVARVIGWAFATWGVALYWWSGLVYLRQTVLVAREFPVLTQESCPTDSADTSGV